MGSADFCAAADHFVLAFQLAGIRPNGIAVTKGSNCQLDNSPAGVVSIVTPPDANVGLNTLATVEVDALVNLMHRGDAAALCPGGTPGLDGILGADQHILDLGGALGYSTGNNPSSKACVTWEMASLGWPLSPMYDQSYYFYNSRFSLNGYSNSSLDQWTSFLEYNASSAGAVLSAESSEYLMGTNVVNLPVWSSFDQFAYTKGWSGIVNSIGNSIPNYWTAQNAWRPDPGIPGTLSWGFTNAPETLNVYNAFTQWDTFVLSQLYDSIGALDPLNNNQYFDYLASGHSTPCNTINNVPCDLAHLGYTPPAGTVEATRFSLRPDIYWHDGERLNSSDVRFSLISYRDTSTASYTGFVQDVVDVHLLSATNFDILFSKHSPFHLLNVATLPIIPAHLWATGGACNTSSCTADPNKTSFFYDPVANHILIGSGPYLCRDRNTGQLGGGCTSSGNEHVAAGGGIALRRFGYGNAPGANPTSTYFRSAGTLALAIWAGTNGDANHDSVIVGSAAFCFGKAVGTAGCTRWQSGMGNPGGGTPVGVTQIAIVNRFAQDGNWISPFNWLPGIPAACCPFTSNPPDGIASATPILYEGTATLSPCNIDPANGYDC